jgi:hypothetical protein
MPLRDGTTFSALAGTVEEAGGLSVKQAGLGVFITALSAASS